MDQDEMKIAILKQEQTFRQQVHELHRVYHVQKQLMREMQTAGLNRVQAEVKKPKLDVWPSEKASNHEQLFSFSDTGTPASAEECNLELTLATGSSSASQKGKHSNSDSGTAVSSTSTDSELAQLKECDVTEVMFQSESKKFVDELRQSPWLHQCVSLKMA